VIYEISILLITVTGLDNQKIELNPDSIVSIRPPRVKEHFGPGIKCLIHTTDGKIVIVVETCDEINGMIDDLRD